MVWKTGEMAIASAQVTGLRTKRIALAGSLPGPRDQREFALMGQEKGAAAMESAQAVGAHILMLNQQHAALAFKQILSASVSLMSIAASRSAAESVERQSKFARDSMAGSIVAASKLSGATAQLTRRALTELSGFAGYERIK